jgi:hypothetical protein
VLELEQVSAGIGSEPALAPQMFFDAHFEHARPHVAAWQVIRKLEEILEEYAAHAHVSAHFGRNADDLGAVLGGCVSRGRE